MKNIKGFKEFNSGYIYENSNLSDIEKEHWPSNWKEMGIWKSLEDIGFVEVTTPLQAKNSTIMLKTNNPSISYMYPDGIVLQKSGYIRDKAATSGFIKRYQSDFTLYDMLLNLLDRFSGEIKRNEPNENTGPLTASQIIEINKGTRSKWKWNRVSQAVDISGTFSQDPQTSDPDILASINFGTVKGKFVITRLNDLESLEFLPEKVGGEMLLYSLGGIKDLMTFPTIEVSESLRILSVNHGRRTMSESPTLDSLAGYFDRERKIGAFQCDYFYASPFDMEVVPMIMDKGPGSYIDHHYQNSHYMIFSKDDDKFKEFIATTLPDSHFQKNPLDLQYLKNYPDIKDGVLKRTGLRDFSDLGFALKQI
jgi:hypothetical protein